LLKYVLVTAARARAAKVFFAAIGNVVGLETLQVQCGVVWARRRHKRSAIVARHAHMRVHAHTPAASLKPKPYRPPQDNLLRWRHIAAFQGAFGCRSEMLLRVESGDWGEVTGRVTKEFGQVFAVLNMANALTPGGAYLEGMGAQEENMFRRTDAVFHVDCFMDARTEKYHPHVTDLLNAVHGEVMLDTAHPRICIRGPEKTPRAAATAASPPKPATQLPLGYDWLPDADYFPFYELRAAADDNRHGPFNERSMRRKVAAQLDTATSNRVRHLVLSAFGCGVFNNPPLEVARLYKEELAKRPGSFDVVVFAIYHAGYGTDNYGPFAQVLMAHPQHHGSHEHQHQHQHPHHMATWIAAQPATVVSVDERVDGLTTEFRALGTMRESAMY
jgi:hypothetical protein